VFESNLERPPDSVIIASMLAGKALTGKHGTPEHFVFQRKLSKYSPCCAPNCLLQFCLQTL
jgi:hypothetical protein